MAKILSWLNKVFTRTSRNFLFELLSDIAGEQSSRDELIGKIKKVWLLVEGHSIKLARQAGQQIKQTINELLQGKEPSQPQNLLFMSHLTNFMMLGKGPHIFPEDQDCEVRRLKREVLKQDDPKLWLNKVLASTKSKTEKSESLKAKGQFKAPKGNQKPQETLQIQGIQEVGLGCGKFANDLGIAVTTLASKSKPERGGTGKELITIPAFAILNKSNGYEELQNAVSSLVNPNFIPVLTLLIEAGLNYSKPIQLNKTISQEFFYKFPQTNAELTKDQLTDLMAILLEMLHQELRNHRRLLDDVLPYSEEEHIKRIHYAFKRRVFALENMAFYKQYLTTGEVKIFQEGIYGPQVQAQSAEFHYQNNYGKAVTSKYHDLSAEESINQYFQASVLVCKEQWFSMFLESKHKNQNETAANLILRNRIDITGDVGFVTKFANHYYKITFASQHQWNAQLLEKFLLQPTLFQYHLAQLQTDRSILLIQYEAGNSRTILTQYYTILHDFNRSFLAKRPQNDKPEPLFASDSQLNHNMSLLTEILQYASHCEVIEGHVQPVSPQMTIIASQQRQIQKDFLAFQNQLPTTINAMAAASYNYEGDKVQIHHNDLPTSKIIQAIKKQKPKKVYCSEEFLTNTLNFQAYKMKQRRDYPSPVRYSTDDFCKTVFQNSKFHLSIFQKSARKFLTTIPQPVNKQRFVPIEDSALNDNRRIQQPKPQRISTRSSKNAKQEYQAAQAGHNDSQDKQRND